MAKAFKNPAKRASETGFKQEQHTWLDRQPVGPVSRPAHHSEDWLSAFSAALSELTVEARKEFEQEAVALRGRAAFLERRLVEHERQLHSLQAAVGVIMKRHAEQDLALSRRFADLVAVWKSDRGLITSIEKMAMHPAYQQIIAMGPTAVPLLLAELQREPDHWFWALHVLTGANPVPEESAGRIAGMAKAWIEWGREHGYSQQPAT